MADTKLPALTDLSVPDLADRLYIVDVSDTTDDPTGSSRDADFARVFGQLQPKPAEGRLTLSSGNPLYAPVGLTPSATDTTGDTVDFAAAHGWTVGTIVTPVTTGGGLTLGTRYYLNIVDADTVSFHTTLANALAGTSKVDLTASITSALLVLGVGNQTIYFTPYNGNRIALYDGTRWALYVFTERSLALGTLTASLPHDVFIFDNSGTLTLELTAWTSDTARATALVAQDGIWCKTGALTRRYLGTIRTVSTTATEDSWFAVTPASPVDRFVWNLYNQREQFAAKIDTGSHVLNNVGSHREWNNTTTNRVEWVVGVPHELMRASISARATFAASTGNPIFKIWVNGIEIEGADALATLLAYGGGSAGGAGDSGAILSSFTARLGYSYATLSEFQNVAQNVTVERGRTEVYYRG